MQRDMYEKSNLIMKFEELRESGLMNRHLLRNYNDMLFHYDG